MANLGHLKILMQGAEAWNQWRFYNPNVVPDFGHADLAGLEFSRGDLSGADLSDVLLADANLKYVYLHRANLSRANLTDADISGATLNNADLSFANLSGANLSGTELTGARLFYTNLAGVKLYEASLSMTNFAGVDLRKVVGLKSIEHRGPSELSLSTIYASAGEIPIVFLRGCGLQDWEIESVKIYQQDLTHREFCDYIYRLQDLRLSSPIQFYSCFISYSHADKPFARRLHDALQSKGIRCWLDEHQLLPGDKIYTEVDKGIRLWDMVLLCCSQDSLRSWWVDNEIETAFEKEQNLRRERNGKEVLALIPLNLDGYLFRPECVNAKAAQIRSRLAADFTGWEADDKKFEGQLERLVRSLRADAGGREVPPAPKL